MFETAVLSYGPNTKRVWTTAMGFTGQALLVAGALLIPLISPQVLPRATWMTQIVAPGPPPPPPPPGDTVAPHTVRVVPTQIHATSLWMPRAIPPRAIEIVDPDPVAAGSGLGVEGGIPGGQAGGDMKGVMGGILVEAARIVPLVKAPEPVKPKQPIELAPATKAPPRITQLSMATPIRKVEPVYPKLAKDAHISGTVELLGVLGVDGRIHELKVLRGHPLLVNAAVDAVRQWVFQPTILNGQAVEVSAPITVNFILNR